MKHYRDFWPPEALLGTAAGVLMGPGQRHTEPQNGRELVAWELEQNPRLWSACWVELGSGAKPFVSYVIRYRQGTKLDLHADGANRRMIVVCAREPDRGGRFAVGGHFVDLAPGDAVVFDADKDHGLSVIEQGERWVFAMGVQIE